jgi:putative transposase
MVKGKPKKSSPGQMAFPWAQWEAPDSEVHEVAQKLVFANCYNPQAAGIALAQCPVSES